jgi:hypothetical protein
LAYCYHNYLFACQICNQTYKKDGFPLRSPNRKLKSPSVPSSSSIATLARAAARLAPSPTDKTAVSSYVTAALRETADLVDPYIEDPEKLFSWEVDETLKEITISPKNVPDRANRAIKAVRDFYGLDREELRGERFRKYEEIQLYMEVVKGTRFGSAIVEKTKKALRSAMAPDSPYAGMARYFIRDVWKVQV